MEIWKDVIGFEGRFKVSNYGQIVSINGKFKGEKIMGSCIEKTTGYNQVVLNAFGKRIYTRIHRLVAEHFVSGQCEINNCVNHLDGNKQNNHFTNLEWTTIGQNTSHAYRTGIVNRDGENSSSSKLTNEIVLKIRELKSIGMSRRKIKEVLNLPINERHISDICNRICWKHI